MNIKTHRKGDEVMTRFAAIDIGSYEVKLKVYEMSSKTGIKMIDTVRHVMGIGHETYVYKKISKETVQELCQVLEEYKEIMKTYQVQEYEICSTSAFREAANRRIVLDRIRVQTGMEVKVLGNAIQRFYNYKALVLLENDLKNVWNEGAAIVDVGPGSIQISLVQKKKVVATQNIKLGSLRIRETLYPISREKVVLDQLILELMDNDMQTFKRMYLKDYPVKHVIAVGDYILYLAKKDNRETMKLWEEMEQKQFLQRFETLKGKSPMEISTKLNISEENAALLMPCAMAYERILDVTNAQKIWLTAIDLCDGMAVNFGDKKYKLSEGHDFKEDTLESARMAAQRYNGNMQHITLLEDTVIKIFDAMKKYHGFGKSERNLLQIAAILHDCGKYISMNQSAQCSYYIIQATEIIGLTEHDKEIVANIVKYNNIDIPDFENERLLEQEYDIVTKLAAILRVANAIDRSHKHKFKDFVVHVKDDQLIITAKTNEDITLERGLFPKKAEFFQEVYGITPILKKKGV